MFFGRKNPFSATDAFPLSDAVMEFDDSSSAMARPARRAMDGLGPRSGRSAGQKWRLAGGLIGLYVLAMAGFYALGMVDVQVLAVLVVLAVLGCGAFWGIFSSGLHKKVRHRHLKLAIVATALACMVGVFYLAPVTQILLVPFTFVAVAYGIFTVPRPALLALAACMLCLYAVVVGLHYVEQKNDALLRLEALHWLALALSLPTYILLMGRVQRLYRSLYHASRKIKNIQEDAQRDPLVGCFNRRYVLAALEEQKQLADESGIPLCLAVVDIDHFKRINDELGHLGGDEVLRTFARVAQQGVRAGDVFGRYGGEEFLLIFPATSLLPALNTCERIRAQVEIHAWAGLLKGRVTVSIGVTQYVLGESVLEFFSRADTAMYMAKEGGRNQVVVEEPVARGDSLLSDIGAHAPLS
ncbi:GGDEF domain-containing protein [Acidovorax sp. sif1233]|uniref:GGDEF domain-containing protein n=1 Tax=Acidovorax sp. sif1233 TaxID=2854792 RepID=UPI001C4547B6|nr:GGDEF domain-containing protein [Acidovorax sp. sif1233]MBV7455876.1 GGDEF domain-containing protein [Acidovorax sp. sif1233]